MSIPLKFCVAIAATLDFWRAWRRHRAAASYARCASVHQRRCRQPEISVVPAP